MNQDYHRHQQYGGQQQLQNQRNFSGHGHQLNAHLNGTQGQYGVNQQGQYGVNQQNHLQYGQQNNGVNQQNNADYGSVPTTPEGIRQHITKRPYTQTIDFEDITYSFFPKKMKTMCLTHDRFLLLKGIEILGYARELPQNTQLPFISLNQIPAPKTVVPLSGIAKVDVQAEKLIVLHADQQKTVWEFHCPTKGCALEWQKKIIEAMDLLREFQDSSFQSSAEFYRFKKGGSRFEPSLPPPVVIHREPTPPQNTFNFTANHDDQISRSIFDSSGPKANPHQFTPIKSNTNGKDYYSIVRNPEEPNLQADSLAHKCSHCGSTIVGSSQRAHTMTSVDSTGRYPKGVSLGGQRSQLQRQYDQGQGQLFSRMGNAGDFNTNSSNNHPFHYRSNY